MNTFIESLVMSQESLAWEVIVLNNVFAFMSALFIMLTYKLSYTGTHLSQRFNVSLGMISLITAMIMSLIGSNIALSLGLVGALSIIRFRTAIKDVRDASFIFWGIAAGIGSGVSEYLLVALGSFSIFIFLVLFRQGSMGTHHILVVQCKDLALNHIETLIQESFGKKARLNAKNVTVAGVELIYILSEGSVEKQKSEEKRDIVDRLMKLDGLISVNLIEQNDVIAR